MTDHPKLLEGRESLLAETQTWLDDYDLARGDREDTTAGILIIRLFEALLHLGELRQPLCVIQRGGANAVRSPSTTAGLLAAIEEGDFKVDIDPLLDGGLADD